MDLAVAASHFGRLPPDLLNSVLRGARRLRTPSGTERHREGDRRAHLEVEADGLARVSVAAPSGRSLTVRYCRRGSILGALSLYAQPFSMPATVQCLVESEFLILDAEHVRSLADRDPQVAEVLLSELSERAMGFISEIPGSVFATVRQRTARHLLDMTATSTAVSPRLEVRISQGDLAESIGTAREVLVRILRAMRREGLVETRRGVIIVLDPMRLAEETFAFSSNSDTGPHRNPGS